MKIDIFTTGPYEVNTYILKDEETKEAVLIDVGGSFNEIKKSLDKDGYEIKYILNTHGHFDHILGEIEVQKNFPNIPIYISEKDKFHCDKLKDQLNLFGFKMEIEPLKPTKFIDETTELKIGNNTIKILETAGHSAGGLSFYVDGKAFTGDALFYGSIGRTDFFDADYDQLITSIKTKLLTLPDETKVYPGHGPSSTIANEKKHNPYLT